MEIRDSQRIKQIRDNTEKMADAFTRIADALERLTEPQTDGYMTAEQTEDYRKMLDKAEHRVYGNIEDEPQADCKNCNNHDRCVYQPKDEPQPFDKPPKCLGCLYSDLDKAFHPCASCVDFGKYVGEVSGKDEPQTCSNCKFDHEEWFEEACDSCCDAHSNWQPKTEPRVLEIIEAHMKMCQEKIDEPQTERSER